MDKAINKELYKKAKKEADSKFEAKTSAYKSMWIQKRYKELGGKYKGENQGKLKQWREEKWIQVKPYLERGEKIECGKNQNKKACRPLKRISKTTPKTIKELVKEKGKKELLNKANIKVKNMKKNVSW